MDTNYWIALKKNPDLFKEFYEVCSYESVKVYFSYGNFIDLAKAKEQDIMSKIIVGIADYCLPPTPTHGKKYRISGNPLSLIPDDDFRSFAREQTQDLGMVETLQYLFRSSDWEPVDEFYNGIEEYRDLTQEYGYETLKGLAFNDHLEEKEDGEKLVLHQHELDIVEYVKGEVYLQRFQEMDPNENPDANDMADLEICTQAILSDCSMLLLESKWVNIELIDRVVENLEDGIKPKVYDDFNTMISKLKVESE
ncbi:MULTISPECIES: hypothetical protein [unclassified Haloarcula]|uniref:hypothetical protein n=1 Tax=unclassified Haloarcula TaxID=2624677 RepID=UPI001CD9F8B0|nr:MULTISPECIES: hypothetical protein [unclassified Haloarcula]